MNRFLPVTLLVIAMLSGCSETKTSNAKISTPKQDTTMVKTYVVASTYKGQLLKAGKPVANQALINELSWNNLSQPIFRQLSTDDKGFFFVEAYSVELDLGALEEFTGRSYLYIEGDTSGENGNPAHLMTITRFDAKEGEEFGQTPRNMICDTDTETRYIETRYAVASGKCSWDNMLQPEW